jgi:hypothetical protein
VSPYKVSREAFEEVRPTLSILLENRATHILHTEVPRRVAYALRQGIHASAFFDDLQEFSALRKMYSFETHPGFVRARWRGVDDIEKVEVRPGPAPADRSGRSKVSDSELEVEGQPFKEKLDIATLPNLETLSGIIDGVNRFGQRVLEVYFPDAHLNEDEMARLYRWASEKGWTLIDNEDAGLTLTHKDVEEGVKWTP